MNPQDNPNHAALIVMAGATLNSLNSAVDALGEFKTPDKKLHGYWVELRRLAKNTYTRLINRLDGPTGDYINQVSNQSEQLLKCLCYLPADQRRKLVSLAEDMALPFAKVEAAYELRQEAVTEWPPPPSYRSYWWGRRVSGRDGPRRRLRRPQLVGASIR